MKPGRLLHRAHLNYVLLRFVVFILVLIIPHEGANAEDCANAILSLISRRPVVDGNVAQLQPMKLKPLDIDTLKLHRKNGTPIYYIETADKQIYIIEKPLNLSDNPALPTTIIVETTGAESNYKITEFGKVRYNKSKKWEFQKKAAFEPEDQENLPENETNDTTNPREKDSVTSKTGTKARYLDCLSLLQERSKAENLVLDYIKTNLPVQIAVELIFNPLATPQDKKRMLSDIVGGVITGSLSTWIGSNLVLKGTGFLPFTAVFLPIGLSATLTQNSINNVMGVEQTHHDGNQSTQDYLSTYNYIHRISMFYPNFKITNWFTEELPNNLYERCRRGENIKIWMRPGSLRLIERIGQAVIYFAPRELLLKHLEPSQSNALAPK